MINYQRDLSARAQNVNKKQDKQNIINKTKQKNKKNTVEVPGIYSEMPVRKRAFKTRQVLSSQERLISSTHTKRTITRIQATKK